MKIAISEKINALEYIILKLIKWGFEDNYYDNISHFNETNNFSKNKVLILPYLIVTANGVSNRRKLLTNTFNKFYIENTLGYYERDVRDELATQDWRIDNITIEENRATLNLHSHIGINSKIAELEEVISVETKDGINHSIDNVYKTTRNIPLYKFSFETLYSNMLLSPIFRDIVKYELYQNEIVDEELIKEELSIFAEEESLRILL